MPFTVPSVSDFKAQFDRDFDFAVPAWGASGAPVFAAGIITAIGLLAGGQGYKNAPSVLVLDPTGTGATVTATISQGRVTAFVVTAGGTGYTAPTIVVSGGAGDDTDMAKIRDIDISNAILDASYNVNADLFQDQAGYARAYLFLVAHCLVERLLAAGQGIMGRYNWLTTSKSAGDLAESFQIPDFVAENPFVAAVSKTRYGGMYLQIVLPLCIGNMGTNFRRTPP